MMSSMLQQLSSLVVDICCWPLLLLSDVSVVLWLLAPLSQVPSLLIERDEKREGRDKVNSPRPRFDLTTEIYIGTCAGEILLARRAP